MWEAIDYSDECLVKMRDMIYENYGDIEISDKEFLYWQYFSNPAGKAVIKLAYNEREDELAGQYVVFPQKMKVHDNIITCVNSLDTLTKERYRGQKIFRDLAIQTYDFCNKNGFPFILIFPNENSRPGFLKYFEFTSIYRFPVLTSLNMSLPSKGKNSYDNITEITQENIHMVDDFWQKNKDKYNILVVRDSEYLRWRYLDVPIREYKMFGIFQGGRMTGYIVGVIKKKSRIKIGVIVDMMLSKSCDHNEAEALIKTLRTAFVKNHASISLAFFPEHSEEYELLVNNLYFKLPRRLEPRTFEVYGLDFQENNLLGTQGGYNKDNWFTSIGDYLLI